MLQRIASRNAAALAIAGILSSMNIQARTVEVQAAWCPGGEVTSKVEITPQDSVMAFNLNGGIRTVPAGGLLDLMTGICHVALSNIGGKRVGVGNCVWTDKDGDKIASSFRREAPAPGKGEVIAGTGKFAGARGTMDILPQQLAGFPGTVSMCIDTSWRLHLQ